MVATAIDRRRARSGDDVDGDAEVVGCAGDRRADVALGAEPQVMSVVDARGEGLGSEPVAQAASEQLGGLAEQRPGARARRISGWGSARAGRCPMRGGSVRAASAGWWAVTRPSVGLALGPAVAALHTHG